MRFSIFKIILKIFYSTKNSRFDTKTDLTIFKFDCNLFLRPALFNLPQEVFDPHSQSLQPVVQLNDIQPSNETLNP